MTVIRRGVKLRNWLRARLGNYSVLGFPTNHGCAGIYGRAATGRASGYNSANDIARAVIKAGKRRRGKAPIGAARLWMDNKFGHIAAVYNKADTNVICNDYRNGGYINIVPRSAYNNLYDAGWCYPEDIPGFGKVAEGANGPEDSKPNKKPVVHVSRVQRGKSNDEVLVLQKALKAEPGIKLDYSSGPGVFGPRTEKAYKKWQKMLGFKPADADGVPGLTSLTELGKRHGFRAAA